MLVKNIIGMVAGTGHTLGNAGQRIQRRRRWIVIVLLNIRQLHEGLMEILANSRGIRESIS